MLSDIFYPPAPQQELEPWSAVTADGGMASIGWIFERLFDLVMPVDAAMNALAGHAFLIAVNLLVLSLICRLWAHSRA